MIHLRSGMSIKPHDLLAASGPCCGEDALLKKRLGKFLSQKNVCHLCTNFQRTAVAAGVLSSFHLAGGESGKVLK